MNQYWNRRDQKKVFRNFPGPNILEIYKILLQVQIVTSNANLISNIANSEYKLPQDLLNDLSLRDTKKLGGIRKSYCRIPHPGMKHWHYQSKVDRSRSTFF